MQTSHVDAVAKRVISPETVKLISRRKITVVRQEATICKRKWMILWRRLELRVLRVGRLAMAVEVGRLGGLRRDRRHGGVRVLLRLLRLLLGYQHSSLTLCC